LELKDQIEKKYKTYIKRQKNRNQKNKD